MTINMLSLWDSYYVYRYKLLHLQFELHRSIIFIAKLICIIAKVPHKRHFYKYYIFNLSSIGALYLQQN
jgi:hypothetical protein